MKELRGAFVIDRSLSSLSANALRNLCEAKYRQDIVVEYIFRHGNVVPLSIVFDVDK